MISFIIHGEPASKSNSRRWTRHGIIKSEKALSYIDTARLQIPVQPELLEGELAAHITIYYASQRPDLDESLILDAMQGRIYKNDRQVREKHVFHAIDKARPRAEIRIEPR